MDGNPAALQVGGNATVTVAGALSAPSITVEGGAGNDNIQTTATSQLLGVFPWTPATWLKQFGASVPFPLTVPVTSMISVEGNAGNDMISLLGTVMANVIGIDGGDGADTITLNPMNSTGGTLAIAGQINITGGAGNDAITVNKLNMLDLAHKFIAGAATIPDLHCNGAGSDGTAADRVDRRGSRHQQPDFDQPDRRQRSHLRRARQRGGRRGHVPVDPGRRQ